MGLLSLTYLDLSCNKIQVIERNVFEAASFLQIINLSGNGMEQITEGTFRARHGMQFLLKVDLSHNPLAVLQDSSFYSLPLLKLLDLSATEVTPRILEDLLQTSQQLRMLILPKKRSCCLCRMKEDIEVLYKTVKRNHPAEDGKSEISATDVELSLNELLPDITLSRGTHWEHQRTSASPPLDFLAPQDDSLLQGVLFEIELNKKLTSPILNAPVRKLVSHVIRILKMDCMAPTIQMACPKLVSRTGLLMKLFSENINETFSLWKSYFWPLKDVPNMTKASSRKQEKPLDVIASHGIPGYGYGNKRLLTIVLTVIVKNVITIICLTETWSWRSAAKDRTFLGRSKKPPAG
uniref:leucine-rich repeat-containing protein 37A3-like n=1 Tax=Euleptes europaea TaxID=460621 RepID=UPI0025415F0B|nr:leucine-rich repeat-containing protein 37A3-like [Euleptes europaea]